MTFIDELIMNCSVFVYIDLRPGRKEWHFTGDARVHHSYMHHLRSQDRTSGLRGVLPRGWVSMWSRCDLLVLSVRQLLLLIVQMFFQHWSCGGASRHLHWAGV